jgi:hypothetical protein
MQHQGVVLLTVGQPWAVGIAICRWRGASFSWARALPGNAAAQTETETLPAHSGQVAHEVGDRRPLGHMLFLAGAPKVK